MATTPTTALLVSKKAQEGIVAFKKSCHDLTKKHWNIRDQMRNIDLAYMRELDQTGEHRIAKIANRYGDATKLQNITVPIVMPQVETAVAYQSSVFLSGNPIFGVVASPKYEDAAMQMETILEDQAVKGGWTRELNLFFRDGFKYNIAAVEVTWESKVTASLETDTGYSTTEGKPKEVIWDGNVVRRLDPYNLIFDTRVSPSQVHSKGEFVGYIELMSRVALKDYIHKLPDKMVDNIVAAFESGNISYQNYFTPQLNSEALLNRDVRASTNWEAWATASETHSKIQYHNQYEVTTLYGRIIPSDFGLRVPSPNTPQVWKFVFVNDIPIYIERQTNAHGYLPILICQPLEDGLDYQTKSFASNIKPIQDVSSALMTSVLASRRRAISDRTLYDPSRIREADINNPNPSAKIPVRPSAYGKNLAESVFPFPFRDDQSSVILQQLPMFTSFADTISGQNKSQQGQFVKGNKTQHEYADVMSNASSRPQSISIVIEAQTFSPLKEILRLNILQFQGGTTLYNGNQKQEVAIDPITLRTAVTQFKVSDGLTPSDKLINADSFQVALQILGSSPQVSSQYNMGALISYLLKTQGAQVSEFEKPPGQVQYEQAVQQWQQTIMQVMKDNPDIKQEQLPPQPQLTQFGMNPDGTPNKTGVSNTPAPTIIEQIMGMGASNQQQPQPQPGQ